MKEEIMFKRLLLLITICCVSCYSDSFGAKKLIGMTKQEMLRQTFSYSPKTKQGEVIIFTWEANGSIISHCYSSVEKALNDSDSLLNKDIWGIDFRKKFSLFGAKSKFILLHFHEGKVKSFEYKIWIHK
jgi:hypothetical protein